MKTLKAYFTIILMIVFEVAVGIMLITKPDEFKKTVVTVFGILFLLISVINLVKYLRARKKEEGGTGSLLFGIVALIIGIVCVIFAEKIIGKKFANPMIYGVSLIMFGLEKSDNYHKAEKAEVVMSKFSVLSALLSKILGIVIIFFAKDMVAAIMLLALAVLDVISIIQGAKIKKESK